MLLQMIKIDIIRGLYSNRKKILFFAGYMVIYALAVCYKASTGVGVLPGLGGYLCNELFSGISIIPYKETGTLQGIELPADWLILFLFAVYILGDYIYEDMFSVGLQKIIMVGRNRWWISKICYIIVSMIIYLALLIGLPMVIIYFFNGMSIIKSSVDPWIFGCGFGALYENTSVFWTCTIIIPILCMLSITIWHTVLSMIFTPAKAFIMSASYLTIGIYYLSPYFIGNQLMMVRCDKVLEGGINPATSIMIDVILIVFGLIIGYTYIKKRDMLDIQS